MGQVGALELEETLLYASVDPVNPNDAGLKRWLTDFLDRQPSWRVTTRDRRAQPRSLYCRHCQQTTERCPSCRERFIGKPEKGVDAAIVTDLLSLAWQNAFDVAILITSDADFVPAVERVQERGLKVINGGWRGVGHQLKTACWANFELDSLIPRLCR
ncbi:MAG TPA: NYN domain-containing protein [Streptosporangiaceae bacterium]